MLRRPSLYLAVPLLFSCGLTWFTYDLPAGYSAGLLVLVIAALATVVLDSMLGTRLPPLKAFSSRRYCGTRDAFLAQALGALIALFCVLDLALFPIPLIRDPKDYAVLSSLHAQVRHVSNMCWVLVPIGWLCVRRRGLRRACLGLAFIFPVLVIDRNRLFASLFSLVLLMALRRDERRPWPWKRMLLFLVAGAAAFSVLGMVRSGSIETVALPFSAGYRGAPQGLQWLLLYITAGPYNFSAILAKHYLDGSFLIHQIVPFTGSVATAGTSIPLDASNINVGTEFFPFLMALGPSGAVAAVLALYALLLWSVRRLGDSVPLFALLMFLRVSYACVMSPFAPQAFTWTTVGFLALCLVLHAFTVLLPNRRDGGDAIASPLAPPPVVLREPD